MGYYSKAANRYIDYTTDDLVTETIKSNDHAKIANYMEILKMDGLPADVVTAISAQIVDYVRNNSAS